MHRILVGALAMAARALLGAAVGCGSGPAAVPLVATPTTAGDGGAPPGDGPSFAEIALDSREIQACSPAAPRVGWRGVLIRAPQTIRRERTQVVPICGYYAADLIALSRAGAMVVAVTDLGDGTTREAEVLDQDPGHMEPNPNPRPLAEADLAGMAQASYFSFDVSRFVPLPARAGRYRIVVRIGGASSAPVEVEVGRSLINHRERWLDQVRTRVLDAAPATGKFVIHLGWAQGDDVARAAEGLRERLAPDPRVVWPRIEKQHDAPVADGAGGHVHPGTRVLVPRPMLIVWVSAAGAGLAVSAREPGRDPLGPPEAAWLWTMPEYPPGM